MTKSGELLAAPKEGIIAVRHFAGHLDHHHHLDIPLRVAHITDQHFGRVTPHWVQLEAIEKTNATNPDLVVLTGDFVAHSLGYLDAMIEGLSKLNAPAFAVLGNHDYWSGADEVIWALQKAGVEVLRNDNTEILIKSQRLQIVGVDDSYTGHADLDKALKGLRGDLPTLGLSHIAEEADRMWADGVPLVLSGHTHAGQITVARMHEMAIGKLAGHKYVHGLYGCRAKENHHGAVYVGAGIGASIFPFRFGDRGKREVTIFELGEAPGELEEHHVEQPAFKGRVPTDKQKLKRVKKVQKKAAKRAKQNNKNNKNNNKN